MYQDDEEITINKQDILQLISEIDKKLTQRNQMKELGIQSIDEVNEIFNAHFTYKMHPDEIRKVKGFVIEVYEEYQRQIRNP